MSATIVQPTYFQDLGTNDKQEPVYIDAREECDGYSVTTEIIIGKL